MAEHARVPVTSMIGGTEYSWNAVFRVCPICAGPLVIAEPAEPEVGIMLDRHACDQCDEYLDVIVENLIARNAP